MSTWLTSLCRIGVLLFVNSFHPFAFADTSVSKTPWSLLEENQARIFELASDDEALTFFHTLHKTGGKTAGLHAKLQSSPPTVKVSPDVRQMIIHYMTSLAVTAHTRTVRKDFTESTGNSTLPPTSAALGETQVQWLVTHPPFQSLQSIRDTSSQILAWSQPSFPPLSSGYDFADYAAYYDRTYPGGDEKSPSWAQLLEQQGRKGIEARLSEYWQTSDLEAGKQKPSEDTQKAFARRYIVQRLLPMFRASLLTQIFRLEAMAYDRAVENWNRIHQWQGKERTRKASLRLCGTWRWIVHNHQNHGDHKMMLTFSHPDHSSANQPEPAVVSIQGDTVYLQWSFPQGIQEDSLLLSNHDSHLEGTFKNSLGPHGSISGKRISDCPS